MPEQSPCETTGGALSQWLDGSLSDEERELAEDHMRECPACRELWNSLRDFHSLFSEAPPIVPPIGFAQRVMSQIKPAKVGETAGRSARRFLFAGLGLSLVSAASLVLIFALFAFWLWPVLTHPALAASLNDFFSVAGSMGGVLCNALRSTLLALDNQMGWLSLVGSSSLAALLLICWVRLMRRWSCPSA